MLRRLFLALTFCTVSLPYQLPAAAPYFHIQVVDADTGRGVPLVELETVNNVQHVTDSAGNIAFFEPGLMDREVFFHVRSHGYEYPKDGFGFRGLRLQIATGGSATIKLPRRNIAERLYRVTGGGIYRDTVLLGLQPPTAEPVLNSLVFGSDSVVNALYRDRLYWFWGDTNRPKYPLGIYEAPGATSRLPHDGGLDPSHGVNLEYFTDDEGFAKSTAKMPGQGPTWIFGMTVLKNAQATDELWTGYIKVEPPLKIYARGVARFNDQSSQFDNMTRFEPLPVLYPEGQTLKLSDGASEHIYFCTPYPLVRVKATPEAYQDPQQYEAYTCLKEGSTLESPQIDRDTNGRIRYGWKRRTARVGPTEQVDLIRNGNIKPAEGLLRLKDRDTGKPVVAHTGTVNWNAYRKRWVMLLVEIHGTSELGEMWYSEADSPLGPWLNAVKVATHEKYSFYNPKHHVYFDQAGGRLIYFEGTYTHSFSGNQIQTPRYEYNQMMYRLDLADPRLSIPVPVYQTQHDQPYHFGQSSVSYAPPASDIHFLALDHPGTHSIPIFTIASNPGSTTLHTTTLPDNPTATPVFHALPADLNPAPPTSALLYEFIHTDGVQKTYRIESYKPSAEYKRSSKPLCRVWKPS